jgi:hypothetical protein
MIRNKEKDRKKDRQNDPPRRAAIQIIRLTDYCHTRWNNEQLCDRKRNRKTVKNILFWFPDFIDHCCSSLGYTSQRESVDTEEKITDYCLLIVAKRNWNYFAFKNLNWGYDLTYLRNSVFYWNTVVLILGK